MGAKTEISWTNSTWNPIRGCSRVSEGCRHCYAEAVAGRFSEPGQPYNHVAELQVIDSKLRGRWNGNVDFIEKHLMDPIHWRKPRMIFVNSMSDLFHENVKDEWLDQIFAVMALAPQHIFQVLTKRPERMIAYFAGIPEIPNEPGARDALIEGATHKIYSTLPNAENFYEEWLAVHTPLPNVWLGVSVEDQQTADQRIPVLLQTPAAVRWVSYEPALGPVEFAGGRGWTTGFNDRTRILDWIVVGGESGPGARPFDIRWAQKTVEQCAMSGIACFVKQLGTHPFDVGTLPTERLLKDRKGGDMSEWPEDLRVREYPK